MRYRRITLMARSGHAPHVPEATVTLTEYDDRMGEYVVGASVAIGQGPMDDKIKGWRLAVHSLSHVRHAVHDIKDGTGVGRYIREQNYIDPPEAILSAEWREWDGPPVREQEVRVYSDLPWPLPEDFPATVPGWYIDRPGYQGLGCPPYTERVYGTVGEVRVNGWSDTVRVAYPAGEVTRTSPKPSSSPAATPDGATPVSLVLVAVEPCPRYGFSRRRGLYTLPASLITA